MTATPAPAGHGTPPPLLDGAPRVVTVGAQLFADALAAQGVAELAVDWRPPPPGTADALAAVLGDPRHEAANATAVGRLLAAAPQLVAVRPAGEALGLAPGELLHAGPPVEWDRASGPLRGALVGAVLLEGLAATPEEAAHRLAAGAGLRWQPCHHRGAVGPMAGVVSRSMWLFEVADPATGGRAWCSLNEGLGKVLRYGAFGPEVLARLQWMGRVLGPLLAAAVRRHGPLDVRALIAQALQMGDELHNRNRAATALLVRELAADLVAGAEDAGLGGADVAAALRFLHGNDHFFLNVGMAAAKLAADAARDIPGSSLVVAMARNGTDFGIQVSGTGDRWFTAPATVPEGLYLPGFGPADANPDIGDSAITETVGLGGFALAAAPAIVRFIGGDVPAALAATRSMYEITLAEHPVFQVPVLDFRGTPTGIDVTAVLRTGLVPVIDTGIAGRQAGTGQVGAGLVTPPLAVFVDAVHALAGAARSAPLPPG
ncbi:MAG: DUF1116 domain-containing protein [Actinomycetota bacterium]